MRPGCPFVPDQRSEGAGDVVSLRDFGHPLPHRLVEAGTGEWVFRLLGHGKGVAPIDVCLGHRPGRLRGDDLRESPPPFRVEKALVALFETEGR